MEGNQEIIAVICAGAVFVIGLLLAIPSPIDIAVIIAESFKSTMPSDMAVQIYERTILELRILGWVVMIADIIGFIAFFGRLRS